MKRKKFLLITCIIVLFFATGIFGLYIYQTSKLNAQGWVSSDNALKDLEECVDLLQSNHPMCYAGLPHETDAIYRELKQKYRDRFYISGHEEYLDLSRLTSSLQDGHTRIAANGNLYKYLEPLESKYISDIEFDHLDGKIYLYDQNDVFEVKEINQVSAEEIIERCRTYFPTENEYGIKSSIEKLTYLSRLVTLDIARSTDKKLTISFYDKKILRQKSYYFQRSKKEEDKGQKPLWGSEFFPEDDHAVLTIYQCINSEEFQSYLDNFFKQVISQDISNVAIDIRKNVGGNSIYSLFFKYLPGNEYIIPHKYFVRPPEDTEEWTTVYEDKADNIFDGKLYVLTSADTFSSAKEIANVLAINDLATIIGEPSSNAPNSYGESKLVEFKSGNFRMQFSTAYIYLSPSLKNTAEVDILCPAKDALAKFKEVIQK